MMEIDNELDCGSYWTSTALFNSLTGVFSASVSMFFYCLLFQSSTSCSWDLTLPLCVNGCMFTKSETTLFISPNIRQMTRFGGFLIRKIERSLTVFICVCYQSCSDTRWVKNQKSAVWLHFSSKENYCFSCILFSSIHVMVESWLSVFTISIQYFLRSSLCWDIAVNTSKVTQSLKSFTRGRVLSRRSCGRRIHIPLTS